MARLRTIKPEFWTSEQIVECSTNARLLFVGMWNFCDDAGVHPASLARLKMEIFPADPFSLDDLGGWVAELVGQGLLDCYIAENQSWWVVTGWKHQKIDRPTFRFPPPPKDYGSPLIRRAIEEYSANGRRSLTPGVESSRVERSGVESSGAESKGVESMVGAGAEAGRPKKDGGEDEDFWGGICQVANDYAQRLGVKQVNDSRDRSLLLKVCALVQRDVIPEWWLADSCEAVRQKKPKRPWAYLQRCIGNRAEQSGQDIRQLLASVNVPEALLTKRPG